MKNNEAQQKPSMEGWAKAYVLAMIFTGVGMLASRVAPGSALVGAGMLAALICAVLATVWVIQGAVAKRKKSVSKD